MLNNWQFQIHHLHNDHHAVGETVSVCLASQSFGKALNRAAERGSFKSAAPVDL